MPVQRLSLKNLLRTTTAVMAVILLAVTLPATAQPPAVAAVIRLSADLTVRRSESGTTMPLQGQAPITASYHIEQRSAGSHWRTSITLTSTYHPRVQTRQGDVQLDDPSVVARIEDDGDGTPVRLFDRRGKPLVGLPSDVRDRVAALAGPGVPRPCPSMRSSTIAPAPPAAGPSSSAGLASRRSAFAASIGS